MFMFKHSDDMQEMYFTNDRERMIDFLEKYVLALKELREYGKIPADTLFAIIKVV